MSAPSEEQSTTPTDAEPPKDEAAEDEDWKVERDHHKAQGDAAFRVGGFKTAIDEYSTAISLDPDFVVAYSNRSAAYLKNSEKSKALKDAQKVVELDPNYAKGHSRLAAALHSLTRYIQAKEAYTKVLELDPSNVVAKKGIEDCQKELDRIEETNRRAFENHQEQKEEKIEEPPVEEEGADEDDLLNDFFDDVEEATKKKPSEPEVQQATNAIKNQKESLGTFEEQVERLLRTNYEWRNLNPFYVLQLPVDASEDDISRRYKGLSLLLHPDKNMSSKKAQEAYDQVQKAKNTLSDPDRARHVRHLMEEGIRAGSEAWKKLGPGERKATSLEEIQEREVMRLFAQIEMKRREVEERQRAYEQRERAQEDEALKKEKQEMQFNKSWRKEDRVNKRVGNWRDFASNGKKTKSK